MWIDESASRLQAGHEERKQCIVFDYWQKVRQTVPKGRTLILHMVVHPYQSLQESTILINNLYWIWPLHLKFSGIRCVDRNANIASEINSRGRVNEASSIQLKVETKQKRNVESLETYPVHSFFDLQNKCRVVLRGWHGKLAIESSSPNRPIKKRDLIFRGGFWAHA